MKLLYVSIYKSYKKAKEFGVAKKIEVQKKQFEKAGIKVRFVDYVPKSLSFGNIHICPIGKCERISNLDKYDAVYIRFAAVSWDLIRFVKKYKRQRPDGKVLLEIPTYPYKEEMCSTQGRLYYYTTHIGLLLLHDYINRFVLVSSTNQILLDVPVINIRNFVDYDSIPVRKPNGNTNTINIACVASFNNWHGYDRLLEGLKDYVSLPNHEDIVLHLVGNKKKLRGLGLEQIIIKYDLQQYVLLYGILTGKKLDTVYDMCDLACNSLGLHRIGLNFSSSLKTREYAAKGLPMLVSSALDIEKSDTKQYIYHFPPDESPIDFERVVCFYHGIYDGKDKQNVADEIRKRFEPYCSADECFKSVVQYVINGEPKSHHIK